MGQMRPDYSMGQLVIQVSDVDPVAMLIHSGSFLYSMCDMYVRILHK